MQAIFPTLYIIAYILTPPLHCRLNSFLPGGYNGKDYKVVERFDPRVGIWERVPNMEQSRSYGATAVAGGKIFCFGGRQKEKKVRYAMVPNKFLQYRELCHVKRLGTRRVVKLKLCTTITVF